VTTSNLNNYTQNLTDSTAAKDTQSKETVTYTYNTETHCTDNKCTAYIGWSYALDTDGKWKLIDNASSLKNSPVGCSVTSDKIHMADCLDWNTTYVTIKTNIDAKATTELNKDIPITVWSPNESKNITELTGDYKKDYVKTYTTTANFASDKDIKSLIVPFGFNKILEFGNSSTIIILNESNSGNVGDAEVYLFQPTYNYGKSAALHVAAGTTYTEIIFSLWNLGNTSNIPAGVTINNANLSFYHYSKFGTGTEYYLAYNTSLYNSTGAGPWVEGSLSGAACSGTGCLLTRNLTWNNQPSAGTLQDNKTVVLGTYKWYYWNVTNATIAAYANTTNQNMSIELKDLSTSGAQYGIFYSKEEATQTTLRPQLTVTYTLDTTLPTYSLNSTNSTLAGTSVKHSLNWTDDVGLSGYIFSFDNCTGTLTNDTWTTITTWSNVTKTINSTTSCTIRWCVYANDTSNNWNGTSCSSPFNYLTTSGAVSTCSCPASGDWTINCAENCDITSNCNVQGNNIYFYNTGTIDVMANVYNFKNVVYSKGCIVVIGKSYKWGAS
jgi:hypothetical protein